jgi:hypothetical protein
MKTSVRQKRIGLAILGVSFLAGLLYPFETTIVPEWKAQVVDESGQPLRGVLVSEQWQHYSIETEGHEAETRTDKDGYIAFPRRSIRASLLIRAMGPVRNTLSTGVHSSLGRSSYLIVFTGYEHVTENAYYRPGEPLPRTVVIRRVTGR